MATTSIPATFVSSRVPSALLRGSPARAGVVEIRQVWMERLTTHDVTEWPPDISLRGLSFRAGSAPVTRRPPLSFLGALIRFPAQRWLAARSVRDCGLRVPEEAGPVGNFI